MQSPQDLSRELEVAHDVALEATALVSSFAGRPLEVMHKAGGEPVSRADLESSELIVRRLAAAFPGDAILTEESPDDGSRLGKARVWMIDPIDGTRDFLRGEAGFAVMIGLCHEGRPVLGVVTQPATGHLWMGVPGLGAWKEEPGKGRAPLRVSDVCVPGEIRLVTSKSNRVAYYERFCRALGTTNDHAMGSVGLKMSVVAEGARDLYIYHGSHAKMWDSCGPEAILTAAGGKVTDIDGNELCYTREELRHPRGMVASNGCVHDLALATVTRLQAELSGA
jgi:3'(2'), 5'-bisphosphate nucleotidase